MNIHPEINSSKYSTITTTTTTSHTTNGISISSIYKNNNNNNNNTDKSVQKQKIENNISSPPTSPKTNVFSLGKKTSFKKLPFQKRPKSESSTTLLFSSNSSNPSTLSSITATDNSSSFMSKKPKNQKRRTSLITTRFSSNNNNSNNNNNNNDHQEERKSIKKFASTTALNSLASSSSSPSSSPPSSSTRTSISSSSSSSSSSSFIFSKKYTSSTIDEKPPQIPPIYTSSINLSIPESDPSIINSNSNSNSFEESSPKDYLHSTTTTMTSPSSYSSYSSTSSTSSSSSPTSTITSTFSTFASISSDQQPPPPSSSTPTPPIIEDDEPTNLDIKSFLAAPRLTQRVRLKSGRVVSFSEVGDRNGFPVFVFLGMGCVRYFIAFFDDLAISYGLRLICPDRPGIGLSDDVKDDDQGVLKWPDVIKEMCDMMEIRKFFIMAHSAGAPYALACAMKLPEMLQGTIYLVCPWISTAVANNFKWLKFVPTPLMKLTNSAGISLQQMIHGRQPYSTKQNHRTSSGALSAQMSSFDKKQQLGLAILKASFAENLTGANNDLVMCFERKRPFGFSYTDVNHPVHVFHGTKDDRIPVAAVKWMEECMPDCKLTLINGGKHSLFLRAEVVDTIFRSIAIQLHVKDDCRLCKISSKCWLMEEAEIRERESELLEKKKNSIDSNNSSDYSSILVDVSNSLVDVSYNNLGDGDDVEDDNNNNKSSSDNTIEESPPQPTKRRNINPNSRDSSKRNGIIHAVPAPNMKTGSMNLLLDKKNQSARNSTKKAVYSSYY